MRHILSKISTQIEHTNRQIQYADLKFGRYTQHNLVQRSKTFCSRKANNKLVVIIKLNITLGFQ